MKQQPDVKRRPKKRPPTKPPVDELARPVFGYLLVLTLLLLMIGERALSQDIPWEQPPEPVQAAEPATPSSDGDTAGGETSGGLTTPAPGVPVARIDDADAVVADVVTEDEDRWWGPRVEAGYAYYSLADGHGGGTTHAFNFGGYLSFMPWLRTGGYMEIGVREYLLSDQDDLVLRLALLGGLQLPDLVPRVLPYVVATGTLGVLLTKRFNTPITRVPFGVGVEAGVDVTLFGPVWLGLSVAYVRMFMQDHGYDVFMFRARIGV